MIYEVAIKDKVSGRNFIGKVEAENYPDAVKDAMHKLSRRLHREGAKKTHLIQHPSRRAPRLTTNPTKQ